MVEPKSVKPWYLDRMYPAQSPVQHTAGFPYARIHFPAYVSPETLNNVHMLLEGKARSAGEFLWGLLDKSTVKNKQKNVCVWWPVLLSNKLLLAMLAAHMGSSLSVAWLLHF